STHLTRPKLELTLDSPHNTKGGQGSPIASAEPNCSERFIPQGKILMTLASWKKVEAEFERIHARKLQDTAKRANLEAFIWTAPHLEADVAKQLIDEGVMSA